MPSEERHKDALFAKEFMLIIGAQVEKTIYVIKQNIQVFPINCICVELNVDEHNLAIISFMKIEYLAELMYGITYKIYWKGHIPPNIQICSDVSPIC